MGNYRMSVDATGKLYIAEFSDENPGVFIANPAQMDGKFEQFFVGKPDEDGLITNDGQNVGSSASMVLPTGSGSRIWYQARANSAVANRQSGFVFQKNIGRVEGDDNQRLR